MCNIKTHGSSGFNFLAWDFYLSAVAETTLPQPQLNQPQSQINLSLTLNLNSTSTTASTQYVCDIKTAHSRHEIVDLIC